MNILPLIVVIQTKSYPEGAPKAGEIVYGEDGATRDEYEVEEVVRLRMDPQGHREYLVKWKGYTQRTTLGSQRRISQMLGTPSLDSMRSFQTLHRGCFVVDLCFIAWHFVCFMVLQMKR